MAANDANRASEFFQYLRALWDDDSSLPEFRDRAPAFVDDPNTPPFYKIMILILLAQAGPNFQDGYRCLYAAREIWAECLNDHVRREGGTVNNELVKLGLALNELERSLGLEAAEEEEREAEAARLEQFRVAALNRMIQVCNVVKEAKERTESLDYATGLLGSLNLGNNADDETTKENDDMNDGNDEKDEVGEHNNDANDDVQMMDGGE